MRKFLVVLSVIVFILSIASTGFAKEKGDDSQKGNVVSQAVHKAQAEGLKGTELAEKAHEAIKERKEAKDAEMLKKKKGKAPKRGMSFGPKTGMGKGRGKK